ncbi:erythromycin esterase family protein [Streptomyces sp. YIM B13518]|uniref:erythromycin esterase family protein n=1 Tax=Streptomyces sp. YIM B13518 TaxID=3366316 RepID=UPI0036833E30
MGALEGGPEDAIVEHARILVRAADLVTRSLDQSGGEESAFAVRDRAMADAVARLVDADPAARVMVWAHNGHLAKGTYGDRATALGSRLRERYGDRSYALALLFGKGSFLARRGDHLQAPRASVSRSRPAELAKTRSHAPVPPRSHDHPRVVR